MKREERHALPVNIQVLPVLQPMVAQYAYPASAPTAAKATARAGEFQRVRSRLTCVP
jgi:hypothetical protein